MRPGNNDGPGHRRPCNCPARAGIEKAIRAMARKGTDRSPLFNLFAVAPPVLSVEGSYGASRNTFD